MSFRKEILKIHIPTPTDCPAQSVVFCVKKHGIREKSLKKTAKDQIIAIKPEKLPLKYGLLLAIITIVNRK